MKEAAQVLEKRKQGLLSRLFDLKKQIKSEADEREHSEEVHSLEAQIKTTEDEILKAQIETARSKVGELEKEALALQVQRRSYVEQIEKIDQRFWELEKLADEAVPRKKVQTSSKHFVKITRVVQLPRMVLHVLAPPTIEYDSKTETDIIPAIPDHVQRFVDDGWSLQEGEKIEPEELDSSNSKEVLMFNLPDIFSNFDMGSRWITDAFSRGLLIKR